MAQNTMILFNMVNANHVNQKKTPEYMRHGAGTGAHLSADLEKVVACCDEKSKKPARDYLIGMVECQDYDVEPLTKSKLGGKYKALHYIPLTGEYVPWKEAEEVFGKYFNGNNSDENH